MKNYKITVLRGDGIGPEIVNECIKVLDKAGRSLASLLTTMTSCWAVVPLMPPACPIRQKRRQLQSI